MNKKIYNNLNIENLTKTDWFNQFDELQQKEILKGLQENLDISVFANSVFNLNQMIQIRLGLKSDLEVSIYANPKYSWKEMNEIRMNLLKESTL